MEVSDEMVEAALDRWFWNGWRKDHPMAAEWVVNMRSAIRAALAVMPDQYRADWITGRDAAAEIAQSYATASDDGFTAALATSIAACIRQLEPPA